MQLALSLPAPRIGASRRPRPLCFASGANEPGEIRGFVSIGIPVGVSAAVVGPDALAEIHRLAGHAIPVFIDSGAFGEVARAGTSPPVLRPIPPTEWERRLEVYLQLAICLGRELSAVVPDRVGDQEVTLRRMATYAGATRAVHGAGARLLLPLHRGERSLADFHAAAEDSLGLPLVPAFPIPKGGATAHEILRTVETLQPSRVHLLGLGPRSSRARELLRLLAVRASAVKVSMDANLVLSAVGRRADGTASRPLTQAQDEIRARGFEDLHGAVIDPEWGIHADYTDSITFPSEWMGPAALRAVADACLESAQALRWLRDPDAFLQQPICEDDPDGLTWWEHPQLALALDSAWHDYLVRRHTAPRKAEAIRLTFASHPAAGQFTVPPALHPDAEPEPARLAA